MFLATENTTQMSWAPSQLSLANSFSYNTTSHLDWTSALPVGTPAAKLCYFWKQHYLMANLSRRNTKTTSTNSNGTAACKITNNKHSHLPLQTHTIPESSNLMDPWDPPCTTFLSTTMMAKVISTTSAAYNKPLIPALRQSTSSFASQNWQRKGPHLLQQTRGNGVMQLLAHAGKIVCAQCMDINTPP